MDFFLLKKTIGALLMPMPILLLALIATVVAILLKKERMVKVGASFSLLFFLLISTPFLPDYLLKKIESQYPQWDMSQSVDNIVVLGCAHTNYGPLPLSSQLHTCSMIRLAEAMKIYQQNPTATIITSGAKFNQPFSNAEMQKRMLMELGIPEDHIKSYGESRDTEDEAQRLSPVLKQSRFALVTSASHMPRAMRLFQQYGSQPHAAPTDHKVRAKDVSEKRHFLPHSKNIKKMERWWYETLGQTWLSVKAWFN